MIEEIRQISLQDQSSSDSQSMPHEKNERKGLSGRNITLSAKNVLSIEEKRQILIRNMPQGAQNFNHFNEIQINELYLEFVKDPQKDNKNIMLRSIISMYPSFQNKIENLSFEEIKKIYDNVEATKRRSEKYIVENEELEESEWEEGDRIAKMRSQLKKYMPEETESIDQLSIQQITVLYQQNNKNLLKRIQQNQPDHQAYIRSTGDQVMVPQGQQSHHSQFMGNTRLWSQQHFQDGKVSANTYFMMLTDFNPQKTRKTGNPLGTCKCECCQNNLFVTTCKQMFSYIENHK